MKLPGNLSGGALVQTPCARWGYVQVHQSGSHIILDTETPSHQRIAIPAHKSLRIGTLNNILRTVTTHKGVTREEILASL